MRHSEGTSLLHHGRMASWLRKVANTRPTGNAGLRSSTIYICVLWSLETKNKIYIYTYIKVKWLYTGLTTRVITRHRSQSTVPTIYRDHLEYHLNLIGPDRTLILEAKTLILAARHWFQMLICYTRNWRGMYPQAELSYLSFNSSCLPLAPSPILDIVVVKYNLPTPVNLQLQLIPN